MRTAEAVASKAESQGAQTPRKSQVRRQWRKFLRDPLSLLALVMLLAIFTMAVLAPVLAPHDPTAVSLSRRLKPPIGGEGYVEGYYLGTDKVGRDVLSRVIYGSRTALTVAFSSVLLAAVIGVVLGLAAGYYGGWVNTIISTLVDIMMAFPFILLALAVVSVLGSGMGNLITVIGITTWTEFALIVRSETMVTREKDFVHAARALGGRDRRILSKHVLPNVLSSVIVMATLALARTILLESSLSYLGLGVPAEIPNWGFMLADSLQYLIQAPWLGIYPGLAILLTVLSVNLVGDRVRDVLDPKAD